jgi:glucan phosphoethanolaminetransferase (alkaline phosphatase superfamily)
MEKIKKTSILLWLKLFGWAIVVHIILIGLSILEVYLYSLLFNQNQPQQVYESHAKVSAPYISLIFGLPVFFIIARFLGKKNPNAFWTIALGFPLLYILLDLIMLIPYHIDWGKEYWRFIRSFGTKILGSYLGVRYKYKSFSNKNS